MRISSPQGSRDTKDDFTETVDLIKCPAGAYQESSETTKLIHPTINSVVCTKRGVTSEARRPPPFLTIKKMVLSPKQITKADAMLQYSIAEAEIRKDLDMIAIMEMTGMQQPETNVARSVMRPSAFDVEAE